MGVSVIICTFNGAKRLPHTLSFLAKQEVIEDFPWEIIVVDNNSNDNTPAIVEKEWRSHNTPISLILLSEPKPGKSFALLKGVSFASHDLLLICDDDNWLNKDYLSVAYNIMNNTTRIGVLGGCSNGYFERTRPFWFDAFQYAYVVGKPFSKSGIVNDRKYLTGAGMVIRKKIYEQLGRLSYEFLLTCRKGNSVSSGSDSEICLLALYLGYDLYYDDRLQFTHHITANRLKWSYCVQLISKGFAEPQIYYYLYDYCHSKIMMGETPDFSYAYRRNLRKPLKSLLKLCKKDFLAILKYCFFSTPGSKQEITIKAHWNKLRFALLNKKKLRVDFNNICQLMERMKSMETHLVRN